jgi:hypothetical protein
MRDGYAYAVLIRNPQGSKQFRKPSGRLQENVKMNHKQIVYENLDWSPLSQDRCEDFLDLLSY